MPALAVPLIIGAGAKVFGAVQQHRAAGKAAKQQEAAAREAIAVNQQQYLQTRQDLDPYRQQGGQGLTALTALMGLPPVAQPTGMPGQPPIGTTQPGQRGPLPPGATPTGYAVPRGTVPGMGGMTVLRSPDGQSKPVPNDQVDYYLSRGATRG